MTDPSSDIRALAEEFEGFEVMRFAEEALFEPQVAKLRRMLIAERSVYRLEINGETFLIRADEFDAVIDRLRAEPEPND